MSKIFFEDLKRGLADVDAFLDGQKAGFKVTLPEEINVKEIRGRLQMTQSKFSDCFGFSLDAVKHWEGGRRTPEAPVRAFLTVIARDPEAVLAALHPAFAGKNRKAGAAPRRKTTAKANHAAL
jgi:putative transcriptional regulator